MSVKSVLNNLYLVVILYVSNDHVATLFKYKLYESIDFFKNFKQFH